MHIYLLHWQVCKNFVLLNSANNKFQSLSREIGESYGTVLYPLFLINDDYRPFDETPITVDMDMVRLLISQVVM